MAKIPFDIKFRPQIESGEYKVETRDGRPARIICWDKIDDDYPLVALVCSYDDGVEEEFMQEYTLRGEYHARNKGEITTSSKFDLFLITPEPELSEFEDALKDCVNARNPENPMTDEGARNNATILRTIAFKEFKENEASHIKEFVDQKEKEAYERGQAEALKYLPRWVDDGLQPGCGAINISGLCGFDFLRMNGRLLSVSSIKKLPGFKEDEK